MPRPALKRSLLVWFSLLSALGVILISGCVPGQAKPGLSFSSPPPVAASATPQPGLSPSASNPATPVYRYVVVGVYPHDPESYTEGLAYADGKIYESSGLYGQSELREEDLISGRVSKLYRLPAAYFGEGLTISDGSLIQLTWESRVGFIYDLKTFALDEVFSYSGEGWGLTRDDQRLIMSDGTAQLHFLDPRTFLPQGSVQVTDQGQPVEKLNELEYIGGQIYANVFQTDRVAIINPQDGKVSAWLDLSGLLETVNFRGEVDVLNGIAYDSENERIFVTGKFWPYLFQIKLRD